MPLSVSTLINLGIIIASLATTTFASTTNKTENIESFLQCFLGYTIITDSSSHHIIYTPNTTAYNTIIQSGVQNNRFLYSSTDQKPVLIVIPTIELHVQATIICSRIHDLHVRVRSGGHDFEGMSYVSKTDQFIAIDMSNFRSIKIDEEHNTAWVQSGATLGELYYAIALKNNTLAFPAGLFPTVGIGGLVSGGGIGYLTRKYGTAADNIIDAVLVDVNGRILNRETMGEDYFWAIRGGGAASFGVIISFKIKLVYVPDVVAAFSLQKTFNLTQIITKWQEIAPMIDDNLHISIILQAVDIAASSKIMSSQFNILYLGKCAELEVLMMRSFPELGFEAKDCNEMSWLESTVLFAGLHDRESLLDRGKKYDFSYKVKSDFVTQPIRETELEKIWNFMIEAENEDETFMMVFDPFGGKLNEISENSTPFPHRAGNLYIIHYALHWNKNENDNTVIEKHLSWMRKLYEFMEPYVSSNPRAAYLNCRDIDLGTTEAYTIYSEAKIWGEKYFKNNFRKLALVKGKVDPQNYFRNEQSVPPLLDEYPMRYLE